MLYVRFFLVALSHRHKQPYIISVSDVSVLHHPLASATIYHHHLILCLPSFLVATLLRFFVHLLSALRIWPAQPYFFFIVIRTTSTFAYSLIHVAHLPISIQSPSFSLSFPLCELLSFFSCSFVSKMRRKIKLRTARKEKWRENAWNHMERERTRTVWMKKQRNTHNTALTLLILTHDEGQTREGAQNAFFWQFQDIPRTALTGVSGNSHGYSPNVADATFGLGVTHRGGKAGKKWQVRVPSLGVELLLVWSRSLLSPCMYPWGPLTDPCVVR